MQEDFRSLLIGAGLPGVVWGKRPQGSPLPALVLNVVSEVSSYTYGGAVDLTMSRVQCDTYAETYAAAVAIDRALVAAANGYSGTVGATRFEAIFLDSRFDDTEDPASGSEQIHRISRDLLVHHKEA